VRIGKKNQIWVHVDGAFGGSLLLSSQGNQLFKGLEQSDSFAWDPHKLMNIPLIASVILVNNKQQLRQNLTALNDDYLYHENDTADYDLGKKSLQCGRRVDALKLWLAWKFYGDAGYRSRMDNLLNVADYFAKRIDSDPHFEAIVVRQTTTVCFRYLPQQPHDVDTLNEQIREALRKQGNSMVNYGYLGKRFAFRWVVANNEATTADVDRFFENFMHIATQLDQ
jgi:sulfinoalanine decarboxylase